MGDAVLPLATAATKQAWVWHFTVTVAVVLGVANLVLLVAVYGRRLREVFRSRRTIAFQRECEQMLDDLAAGDPAQLGRLTSRIRRLDELERAVAATMLIERLRDAARDERSRLLGALQEVQANELLIRSTRRRAPWRRALAIRTLGLLGVDEAVPVLIERLSDRSRYVREAAARALGRIGDPQALPPIADLLARPDRASVGIVYEALVAFGERSAPVFRAGLASEDPTVRVTSCFGIAAVDPDAARPLLERALADPAAPVRAAACETLGRTGGREVPGALALAARDEQRCVRRAAVAALGSFDDPQAVPPLVAALDDPDRDVALRAGESIVRLRRLPRAGAEAASAADRTPAWPLETALVLDSLGAV